MSDSTELQSKCPACKSDNLDQLEGVDSVICTDCSYVINGQDQQPRSQFSEKDQSTGGQETATTGTDWDHDLSVKDKSEAILVDVLSTIEEIGPKLALTDQEVVRAGEIVTKAWKRNFMHGRTKEGTLAAAVYTASRESNRSIPPGVVAKTVEIDKQRIKKTYRQLKEDQSLDFDPPKPLDYVAYLCRDLGLSSEVEHATKELLTESNYIGGDPVGTAAAGVYEISGNRSHQVTLREVARAASLTKETVWRHTQKLES
jgi:transcription initiation factor TFIIB